MQPPREMPSLGKKRGGRELGPRAGTPSTSDPGPSKPAAGTCLRAQPLPGAAFSPDALSFAFSFQEPGHTSLWLLGTRRWKGEGKGHAGGGKRFRQGWPTLGLGLSSGQPLPLAPDSPHLGCQNSSAQANLSRGFKSPKVLRIQPEAIVGLPISLGLPCISAFGNRRCSSEPGSSKPTARLFPLFPCESHTCPLCFRSVPPWMLQWESQRPFQGWPH